MIIVVPAGFIYGISPSKALPFLFDFNVETVDLNNVFRAIMCLYLAIAVIWILGIVKSEYWKTATLVNMVFMLGLAAGRIISLVIDGVPSIPFVFGLVGELTLGSFAFYQLKKYDAQQRL